MIVARFWDALGRTGALCTTFFWAPKGAPIRDAAEWCEQASALLGGGIPATRVCDYLGVDLTEQSRSHDSWALIFTAWKVIERTGAPLSASLARIAKALRSIEQLREKRRVLLTGSRSTTQLVAALPVLGFVLASLLGFDLLGAVRTGLGCVSLCTGTLLLLAGMVWTRRIAQRMEQTDTVTGVEYELVAVALAGGIGPYRAVRTVLTCAELAGCGWVRAAPFTEHGEFGRFIRLATELGTPLLQLLHSQANASRTAALAEAEAAAEHMSVAVLLPLGACILPAFVFIGVVPLCIAVMISLNLG